MKIAFFDTHSYDKKSFVEANKAFDYEWMYQAKRDAKGCLPAVFHKTDNREILVTMTLDDWFTIYREYEAGESIKEANDE